MMYRFVWLVPEYTTKIEDAVTGFDVFIGAADSRPDLAKGAGGAFRYLVPVKNPRVATKITEVALIGGPPRRWSWVCWFNVGFKSEQRGLAIFYMEICGG